MTVWVLFFAGKLAVINGTMNSSVYQKLLKENVERTWVLQQDDDPKDTSKSPSERLRKKQTEDFGVAKSKS